MTKKQVMKILRANGANTACCGFVMFEHDFDKVAAEIVSLHLTSISDMVKAEQEMLDGYNQEPIPGMSG